MERALHPLESDRLPPSASIAPDSPTALPIDLVVNGKVLAIRVEPWTTLLDLLRDRLLLTGSKKGCDHGQCGACTVLVDGRRIIACLTLAVMRSGCEITTVEGLAGLAEGDAMPPAAIPDAASDAAADSATNAAPALHPLQQAFIEHDAFQCGYCTPGQLCSAVGLMTEGHLGEAQDLDAGIREGMSGNVCRCGAYPQILRAVRQVVLHRARPPAGHAADGNERAAA
ncbi:MAG: (2Fe-2S)-binding protein [Rhodoferax sp.]|nr:(2Fe-2S)-binding protein [Rhodoferax sp.]